MSTAANESHESVVRALEVGRFAAATTPSYYTPGEYTQKAKSFPNESQLSISGAVSTPRPTSITQSRPKRTPGCLNQTPPRRFCPEVIHDARSW
jgi:hypothetical protein